MPIFPLALSDVQIVALADSQLQAPEYKALQNSIKIIYQPLSFAAYRNAVIGYLKFS